MSTEGENRTLQVTANKPAVATDKPAAATERPKP
jgi:hypothetical protein